MAGPFAYGRRSISAADPEKGAQPRLDPGLTPSRLGQVNVSRETFRHVAGLESAPDQAVCGAAQWRAMNAPWVGIAATASSIALRICAIR